MTLYFFLIFWTYQSDTLCFKLNTERNFLKKVFYQCGWWQRRGEGKGGRDRGAMMRTRFECLILSTFTANKNNNNWQEGKQRWQLPAAKRWKPSHSVNTTLHSTTQHTPAWMGWTVGQRDSGTVGQWDRWTGRKGRDVRIVGRAELCTYVKYFHLAVSIYLKWTLCKRKRGDICMLVQWTPRSGYTVLLTAYIPLGCVCGCGTSQIDRQADMGVAGYVREWYGNRPSPVAFDIGWWWCIHLTEAV